jgi:hypothetical protein
MTQSITEPEAIAAIDRALADLADDGARTRVLAWAVAKYGHAELASLRTLRGPNPGASASGQVEREPAPMLEGVNPGASLWFKRNGIPLDERLGSIFSINQSDIDLVAPSVPGESRRARLRSVFLLRGVCALLTTGEFRFEDDVVRTTCKHYDAYDLNNFSNALKAMSSEVTGNKESGYSLTPRGQKAAADLLKQVLP